MTVHPVISDIRAEGERDLIVAQRPAATEADPDPTVLLDNFSGDASELRESCMSWNRDALAWTLPAYQADPSAVADISKVLGMLMDAAAFSGIHLRSPDTSTIANLCAIDRDFRMKISYTRVV